MSEPQTITVRELIAEISGAIAVMARGNPHRTLLIRCGRALIELAGRTHTQDDPVLVKSQVTIQ